MRWYRSGYSFRNNNTAMIIVWLLVITFVSGILAWIVSSWNHKAGRIICLSGLAVDALLILYVWVSQYGDLAAGTNTNWILEYNAVWIKPLGINFHLAMDGLSLLLAALTILLGMSAVACSWNEIKKQSGCFHFTLMTTLTGIIGVFTAIDLFLFYFFWELMLIPMFFLILIWGHENKNYAAIKFFIFTQAGGLLMLLSIVSLYWIGVNLKGTSSFDFTKLMTLAMSGHLLIVVGFFIAFAVKLPIAGLHMWLPDAYTEAPTAGSVILSGLLLKTGAYGIIRFVLPMLGNTSTLLRPVAMVLALVSIFYGALLAMGQKDIKRFIAYASFSHIGFVLLGVFAGTQMALQGAVVIMIAHGLSTGALFIIIGALQERLGTRDITKMGGLWSNMPRMGSMMLFFALASLGLPGLANFIGEFLVLAGTFQTHPWFAGIAAFGFVVSSIYSLWIIFKIFYGPVGNSSKTTDLKLSEMLNLSVLALLLIWIGIFPQTVLNTSKTALEKINTMQTAKTNQSVHNFTNADIMIVENARENNTAELTK